MLGLLRENFRVDGIGQEVTCKAGSALKLQQLLLRLLPRVCKVPIVSRLTISRTNDV